MGKVQCGRRLVPVGTAMCRNIRALFNLDPPANDEEVRDAALQFVRKVSGFPRPSTANRQPFERAVDEVAATSRRLLDALSTNAGSRNREAEAARARARAARRFGTT